jgi:hypothetical protein
MRTHTISIMLRLLLSYVFLIEPIVAFTTAVTNHNGLMSRRPAFIMSPARTHHHPQQQVMACRMTPPFDDNVSDDGPTLQRVPSDEDGVPIPFVDLEGSNFIECYADSFTSIDGVEYTIGVPCDYAVALCYFDQEEQLIPVELDDEMMDDVFPVAAGIVEEEFGEELSLHKTPQTLTLVGELEEDDDDDEDSDDDDDDMEDGEEEVEILLSFEHRGKEFNLVRLLDPVLLVGKEDPENPERRILLSLEESEKVMPVLEGMFLEFHEERDLSM